MELKVRNIDFNYGQDNEVISVNVRYDGFDDGFSISGFVKITEEEYNANATNLVALAQLAKTKVKAVLA